MSRMLTFVGAFALIAVAANGGHRPPAPATIVYKSQLGRICDVAIVSPKTPIGEPYVRLFALRCGAPTAYFNE